MTNQIQLTDEDEVAAAAELEAVKMISARIAEQNALVLESIKTLRGEMVAQAETLTAIFGTFKDALAGLNIVVNVPEQPAPQITVNVPQQPAPVVNIQEPADEPKNARIKVNRGNNGVAVSYDLTVE